MQQKEKVGDLYKQINDLKNAHTYYQMVADDYITNQQMVKASLIYRKRWKTQMKPRKYC